MYINVKRQVKVIAGNTEHASDVKREHKNIYLHDLSNEIIKETKKKLNSLMINARNTSSYWFNYCYLHLCFFF